MNRTYFAGLRDYILILLGSILYAGSSVFSFPIGLLVKTFGIDFVIERIKKLQPVKKGIMQKGLTTRSSLLQIPIYRVVSNLQNVSENMHRGVTPRNHRAASFADCQTTVGRREDSKGGRICT